METIREYFKNEIRNTQTHITTNLQSALTNAIKKLEERQREALSKIRRNLKPPEPTKNDRLRVNRALKEGRRQQKTSGQRVDTAIEKIRRRKTYLCDGDSGKNSDRESVGNSDGDSDYYSDGDKYDGMDMDRGGCAIYSNGGMDGDDCPPECGYYACGMDMGNRNAV